MRPVTRATRSLSSRSPRAPTRRAVPASKSPRGFRVPDPAASPSWGIVSRTGPHGKPQCHLPSPPTALAHLLDGPLTPVVRDVLGGGHLVVRRDLSALKEDLTGRRYPKRRLLELFAAWVDPAGDLPAVPTWRLSTARGHRVGPTGGPRCPVQPWRMLPGRPRWGRPLSSCQNAFPASGRLCPRSGRRSLSGWPPGGLTTAEGSGPAHQPGFRRHCSPRGRPWRWRPMLP